VIVDFNSGARTSLDIAVQEWDSEPIAEAILDARWRGVDVNLFLEQDYLRSPLPGKKSAPALPIPQNGRDARAGATPSTEGCARLNDGSLAHPSGSTDAVGSSSPRGARGRP
jgi:hypothetical protein